MESGMTIGYIPGNTTLIKNIFYTNAFGWNLYLVMLLLPVFLGLVLYVFQDKDQFLFNYVYHIYMYIFKLDFLKFLKLESRIIETAFQFSFMIIMALFTARITIVLQNQETSGGVRSISDLKGLRIATASSYKDYVESVGARLVVMPLFNSSFLGAFDAILDAGCNYCMADTFIGETLSSYQCNLKLPLKNIYKIEYSIIWAPQAPKTLIEKMNFAIMQAIDTKNQSMRTQPIIENFGQIYGLTACVDSAASTSNGVGSINFGEVSSLWVIWLICLLATGLVFFLSRLLKRRFRYSQTPF